MKTTASERVLLEAKVMERVLAACFSRNTPGISGNVYKMELPTLLLALFKGASSSVQPLTPRGVLWVGSNGRNFEHRFGKRGDMGGRPRRRFCILSLQVSASGLQEFMMRV